MFKCPYVGCPFEAETEREIDDHVVYMVVVGEPDEDHRTENLR